MRARRRARSRPSVVCLAPFAKGSVVSHATTFALKLQRIHKRICKRTPHASLRASAWGLARRRRASAYGGGPTSLSRRSRRRYGRSRPGAGLYDIVVDASERVEPGTRVSRRHEELTASIQDSGPPGGNEQNFRGDVTRRASASRASPSVRPRTRASPSARASRARGPSPQRPPARGTTARTAGGAPRRWAAVGATAAAAAGGAPGTAR